MEIINCDWNGRTLAIRGGNDLLPRAFAQALGDRVLYHSPIVRIQHSD
jgi:monoamine oxidase